MIGVIRSDGWWRFACGDVCCKYVKLVILSQNIKTLIIFLINNFCPQKMNSAIWTKKIACGVLWSDSRSYPALPLEYQKTKNIANIATTLRCWKFIQCCKYFRQHCNNLWRVLLIKKFLAKLHLDSNSCRNLWWVNNSVRNF